MTDVFVDDRTTRIADVTVGLPLIIQNPFPVFGRRGAVGNVMLGSAVVTLGNDALNIRFLVDAHTPEGFDLENEVARCRVDVEAHVVNGVLSGTIRLTSK